LVLLLLLIHFLHLSTYDFLSLCCLLLASCCKLTGLMMMSQLSIFAADLWHVLRLSFFSLWVKHKTPEQTWPSQSFYCCENHVEGGKGGNFISNEKITLLSVLVPSDWHHSVKVEQHCILSY
jgi:hypothetical protein